MGVGSTGITPPLIRASVLHDIQAWLVRASARVSDAVVLVFGSRLGGLDRAFFVFGTRKKQVGLMLCHMHS